MNRVLVSIGGVNIYWYSVLILVGVILGYYIIIGYSKKLNYKTGAIIDMMLGIVISAIIGARIYYVVFNFSSYQADLLSVVMIWRGGLAIYGAIIGGAMYMFYYAKRHELDFVKLLDIFSLSLLLGQAIGRWGNFFNGEAYGGKTTLEALQSLHLPDFIIQGMYIDGFYREPTFLYESVWCLIGVLVLYFIRRKPFMEEGKQISFYMVWYGIGRFFIEEMRSDSLYFLGIRVSQVISFILVIVGIIWLLLIKFRKRKFKIREIGGNDGRI